MSARERRKLAARVPSVHLRARAPHVEPVRVWSSVDARAVEDFVRIHRLPLTALNQIRAEADLLELGATCAVRLPVRRADGALQFRGPAPGRLRLLVRDGRLVRVLPEHD